MLWLDGIAIVFGILAIIRGWQKGILYAVLTFFAFFFGILVALKLSGILSEYLFAQHIVNSQYTFLLAFILLFLATILLFKLLIRLVERVMDGLMLGWINRLGGAILYLMLSVFITSTFVWVLNQVGLIKPEQKNQSKSYSFIEPVAPATIPMVSRYLPYCKDLVAQIETHLEEIGR
jgi:membrane protein required for colicin V production